MPITPVDLTDTFDVWRTRTNQLINLAEASNTAVIAAFDKANSANVLAFNTGIGANAYATAATAGANAFMIAVQNGSNTAVGTGANAFATSAVSGANNFLLSVIAGANTAVGTGANAFATAAATSAAAGANAFMIAVQNGANTAVGAGANNYAASTFLANTNGAVFSGNLTISSSLTVSSNLTITSGTIDTARANILSQTLSDGATITWNASLGQIAYVTLGGNRTMAAPTNLRVGTYILHVIQDGSGNRTLTWNSVFKWTAGIAPVLSTTAGRRDIVSMVSDGTNLYGTYMPDVR